MFCEISCAESMRCRSSGSSSMGFSSSLIEGHRVICKYCVLGSSRTKVLTLLQIPKTIYDLKSAICRHLTQNSLGRFVSLDPDFLELVVDIQEPFPKRVVLDESSQFVDIDSMLDGLLTVIPLDASRDIVWRPIVRALDDSRTDFVLRGIELGGSAYCNCFFYCFLAALELYIGLDKRDSFLVHVSSIVSETQEFLTNMSELPDEEMTFETLANYRLQNEELNVVSKYFDNMISVWSLRDLIAHRLPDFLRPTFFKEGACNAQLHFIRWGLHAPVMEKLDSSIQWFHWRMRFPWGVYPDAAKLLADVLKVPVSLYEKRSSKGIDYCVCTSTRIDGIDLKEVSSDPRFGSGLCLLGASGHWQLAEVRQVTQEKS